MRKQQSIRRILFSSKQLDKVWDIFGRDIFEFRKRLYYFGLVVDIKERF